MILCHAISSSTTDYLFTTLLIILKVPADLLRFEMHLQTTLVLWGVVSDLVPQPTRVNTDLGSVSLSHTTTAFHNPLWFSLYLHAHFELTVQKVHMVVWTAIWLVQTGSGATDQQLFSQCYLAVSSPHSLRRPAGVAWNTNNLCYVHAHVNPAYQRGSSLLNCNLYVHHLEYSFMSSSYEYTG